MLKLMLNKFLLAVITLCSFSLAAQPRIKVNKEIHDYGRISESNTAKSEFVVNNVGDDTLRITELLAECGCTKPKISSMVIPPKESAILSVRYEAKGRLGQFNKRIMVYSNGEPRVVALSISGFVMPYKKVSSRYSSSRTELHFSSYQLNFDTMHHQELRKYEIEINNVGKRKMTISGINNSPKWLSSNIKEPISIQPGDKFKLELILDMNNGRNFGSIRKYIIVQTNDKDTPAKMIVLQGYVEPYFEAPLKKGKYKKWLASQPKIRVKENTVDYGKVNAGSITKGSVEISNKGKDTLKIYKLHSQCGCLRIETNKTIILPGEKATITLKFDSINRKERQRKQAYIITNDPLNKQVIFYTDAFVQI